MIVVVAYVFGWASSVAFLHWCIDHLQAVRDLLRERINGVDFPRMYEDREDEEV